MNLFKLSLLGLTLASAMVAQGQTPAPTDLLAGVIQIQTDAYKNAKQGTPVDRAVVALKMRDAARRAVSGVDATQVKPADAAAWMKLYEIADMPKEVLLLGKEILSGTVNQVREAQEAVIGAAIESGDLNQLLVTLKYMVVASPPAIGQIGEEIHYNLSRFDKTNPTAVMKAYDLLLRRLDPDHPLTSDDSKWEPYVFASIKSYQFELLYENGHKTEALAGLRILRQRFASNKTSMNAFGQPPTEPIDTLLNRFAMAAKPAPKLAFDKTIGQVSSLQNLRGKVIVLDFFAHWCIPCRKAFPEIRKIYSDFKDKGLEVLGVTGFYGYYGTEKDLSRPQELADMRKFVVEQNLTWPVAFDSTGASVKAFGAEELPHFVIIDRKGMIRYEEVGYNPGHEGEIRKTIETLLADASK